MIVCEKGKVLLGMRKGKHITTFLYKRNNYNCIVGPFGYGTWALPGGHLEYHFVYLQNDEI